MECHGADGRAVTGALPLAPPFQISNSSDCRASLRATLCADARNSTQRESHRMTTSAGAMIFWRHGLALRLLALAVAFMVSTVGLAGRAEAACTVPNSITNGQVADATAVMGNFNALKDCVDGAVKPSGTPAAGNLATFSDSGTITNGNLSGDCTTAGAAAVTCTKTNGTSFGPFATGTDAGQLTGTISTNRFNNGANADGAHYLRGDGVWETPPGGGGSGSGVPGVANPFHVPAIAEFTIINSGTAGTFTQADQTFGIDLTANDDGSTEQVKAIGKSLTDQTFDLKVRFRSMTVPAFAALVGIGFRDSASGQMVTFGLDVRAATLPRYRVTTRSSFTAAIANPIDVSTMHLCEWLRIQSDGTTRTFSISNDGRRWASIGTMLVSAHAASANQVLFFMSAADASAKPLYATLLDWDFTD